MAGTRGRKGAGELRHVPHRAMRRAGCPAEPASATTEENDYTFERVVKDAARDGTVSSWRIDLYKRGSFVLEAKQSRQQPRRAKELSGQSELFAADVVPRGRRGAERAREVLMLNLADRAKIMFDFCLTAIRLRLSSSSVTWATASRSTRTSARTGRSSISSPIASRFASTSKISPAGLSGSSCTMPVYSKKSSPR